MVFNRALSVKRFLVLGLILLLHTTALPINFSLNGLLTGWLTANTDSLSQPFFGLRYIPEFSMKKALSDKYTVDFELSLNAYGTAHVR